MRKGVAWLLVWCWLGGGMGWLGGAALADAAVTAGAPDPSAAGDAVMADPATPTPAPALALSAPEMLTPFAQSPVVVLCPGPGALSVLAEDAGGEAQPLCKGLRVTAGKTTLRYDARSYAGMPLREGAATLTAVWLGDDGTRATASASLPVARPATVLEYALPQSGVYYLGQKRAWFMDCSVTGSATLNLEIYADAGAAAPVASVRRKIERSSQFRVTWKGTRGKGRVAAGTYTCRVFLSGQKDAAVTFPLEVRAGEPEELPLAPTGPLLPDCVDDAEVWAVLMRPLTVVDIGATKHQRLYAGPDPKSEVLGTVHGQSQGLEVLEIGKSYTLVSAYRHEDGEAVTGYAPTKKLKVVRPDDRYGVVIDKRAQRLTVYERGTPIGSCAVSTGLQAESKLFRETRAGAFLATDRVTAFASGGYRYEYPIRIDGGNLIHQVGFATDAARCGFAAHLAQLGRKASEGCVRVGVATDAAHPINAYWLWTHLPYGTPVLVTE